MSGQEAQGQIPAVEIPAEHKEDSLKLNPPEFLELFQLTFPNGNIVRAHSGPEVSWNFNNNPTKPVVFESFYIDLTGESRNSGEQRIRPILTFANPLDLFSVPVAEGLLEYTEVVRYKVKPENLNAYPPIYEKATWYIAKVNSLGVTISVQLRGNSDRQEGVLPIRQYTRPEFPSVVI